MPLPVETVADGRSMPAAHPPDPMETFAAQVDLALRAANDTLLGSAQAWHAVARTYAELLEAGGRAYGGLLIDWHQRLLGR